MGWTRLRKAMLIVLSGGLLLQGLGGCGTTLAPLIANVVGSLVLNAVLGGLTGT